MYGFKRLKSKSYFKMRILNISWKNFNFHLKDHQNYVDKHGNIYTHLIHDCRKNQQTNLLQL